MPVTTIYDQREVELEYGVSELATRLDLPLSTRHREVVRLDESALILSRTQGRNRLARANLDTRPHAPSLSRRTTSTCLWWARSTALMSTRLPTVRQPDSASRSTPRS